MHVGADILAVSFRPAAHNPKWRDDRLSPPGQRTLEGLFPRSGRAPGDQFRGFQIAQSSGKHALGNVSNVSAQLRVPIVPLFQREQDLRRPSADKDRTRLLNTCGIFVAALAVTAHEINLAVNAEAPGVTSVAGFQRRQCAGSTWTR
jgi:hypothetical protein